MVNDSAVVAADKNSSSGIRYKYGININILKNRQDIIISTKKVIQIINCP